MSNKLDEQGLLTDEAILGIDDDLCHDTNFLDKLVDWEAEKYAIKKYLTDQRDALLELFVTWINEDYRTSVDRHSLPTHLFQRIARLQDKTKAPSG